MSALKSIPKLNQKTTSITYDVQENLNHFPKKPIRNFNNHSNNIF